MRNRQLKKEQRRAEKRKKIAQNIIMNSESAEEKEIEKISRPDTTVAIASISSSSDEKWLRGFRDRMEPRGETKIVAAINKRLEEIEETNFRKQIAGSSVGLNLVARVQESLHVYELLRGRENGRIFRASRTRQMIDRYGEKETVRRIVTNLKTSTGLETLARYDRLDLCYERIILDFPNEFDVALRSKARANLSRFSKGAPIE